MNTNTHEDFHVMQTGVLPSKLAQLKSGKYEPGVQEVRTRFAHIKCELRHIQREFMATPKKTPTHHD